MSDNIKKEITIIGAGLTGSLLAVNLARQNYPVALIESRDDIRQQESAEGRSINLAISHRGLYALEQVELKQHVLALAVPVLGRMIHDKKGNLSSQAYGRTADEHNYSISRFELNKLLLNHAAQLPNVSLIFNQRVTKLDINSDDCVIACDGANSAIRQSLQQQGLLDCETITYPHAYKEIHLTSDSNLDLNHLHIWPRGDVMLMALANHDGSFTCTLYCQQSIFDTLNDEASVIDFFQSHFPDFVPLAPDLAEQFMVNPIGHLVTVKSAPWHYQDKALLLGDAAHAMVPFLGQGMNCGFEDVTIFNRLLQQHPDNWHKLFEQFYQSRKQDADAITQMAQDNYHEMSSDVAKPKFLLKKQIEQVLMKRYPEKYISKYVMISYSNAPYSKAMQAGIDQAALLEELTKGIDDVDQLDWNKVKEILN